MECKVSPEEVKRVKGMGFLWDKRTLIRLMRA